jgi:hypothetical protein
LVKKIKDTTQAAQDKLGTLKSPQQVLKRVDTLLGDHSQQPALVVAHCTNHRVQAIPSDGGGSIADRP